MRYQFSAGLVDVNYHYVRTSHRCSDSNTHIDGVKLSSLLLFVEQPLQNDIPVRKWPGGSQIVFCSH